MIAPFKPATRIHAPAGQCTNEPRATAAEYTLPPCLISLSAHQGEHLKVFSDAVLQQSTPLHRPLSLTQRLLPMEPKAYLERELPAGQGQRRPRLSRRHPDNQPSEPKDQKRGDDDPAAHSASANLRYSSPPTPSAYSREPPASPGEDGEPGKAGKENSP